MKYVCICIGIIGALLLGGCSISNKPVDVPVQDARVQDAEKGNLGKPAPGLTKADSCEAYRAYLLSPLALEIARENYESWVYFYGDVVWHEIEGGWEGQHGEYEPIIWKDEEDRDGIEWWIRGRSVRMSGAGTSYSSSISFSAPGTLTGVGSGAGLSDSAGLSGSGEFTQTNIQEAGVDELDIVKTDGEYLYVLKGDAEGVAIVRAWPATSLGMVAHIPSRADGLLESEADEIFEYSEIGLFLSGLRLIVISQARENRRPRVEPSVKPRVYVDVYDISSPAAPKHIREMWIEGEYETARFVNDRIYLAIGHELQDDDDFDNDDFSTSILDPFAWGWHVEPASDEEVHAKMVAALPAIQAYLFSKGIYENVLEGFPMLSLQGATQALMGCEDIYLPKVSSKERGLLSIVEISGDKFDEVRALGIADEGWEVYASKENFYAVSSSIVEWRSCEEESGSKEEESERACEKYGYDLPIYRSHIHRFELKGGDGHVHYVNSGEVEGVVSNPFWMSEHEGYLRVVSESDEPNWWNREDNRDSRLSVLKIDGKGHMPVVGSVPSIAHGNHVDTVQAFGDRVYVKTYMKNKQFSVLNLSVPESPKIMGELKNNSNSTYIYLLGEDALLMIDENVEPLGIHLQIFDVSDMRNPRRIHQEVIERTAESYPLREALDDHHAFTYHAPSGLLAVPMYIRRHNNEGENFSGVFVYRVTKAFGFEFVGQINHKDFAPSGYWGTRLRRTIFMFGSEGVYDREAYVYTISADGIKVNDANAPSTEFGKVVFGSQE